MELPEALLEHLTSVSGMSRGQAEKVVLETLHYYRETVQGFVVRRHGELHGQGLKNAAIFQRLQEELGQRRFAPTPLSERQLRRLVYG